jgi:hypothetical protein
LIAVAGIVLEPSKQISQVEIANSNQTFSSVIFLVDKAAVEVFMTIHDKISSLMFVIGSHSQKTAARVTRMTVIR